MSFLLALDPGTHQAAPLFLMNTVKLEATAQRETHIQTPHSGWV